MVSVEVTKHVACLFMVVKRFQNHALRSFKQHNCS